MDEAEPAAVERLNAVYVLLQQQKVLLRPEQAVQQH